MTEYISTPYSELDVTVLIQVEPSPLNTDKLCYRAYRREGKEITPLHIGAETYDDCAARVRAYFSYGQPDGVRSLDIVLFNPTVEGLERMTERAGLAHAAWSGQNPALMEQLLDLDGYEQDGVRYPSNGMTPERANELMQGLSKERMAELTALGII